MKRLYSIIKRIIILILGFIWGCVSFYWLGYSILTLGKIMEEPGSYHYDEAEGMRIYGLIGCVIYVIFFVPILLLLYKKKQYLFIFLLSMILGGIISGVYIFVIR
jgi:hypothetical protein